MSEKGVFRIKRYDFNQTVLNRIKQSQDYFENNQWPLVYILKDEKEKKAYVGETTDTVERMKAHLKNDQKQKLSEAFLISSEYFNKSATLDIESNLIKYMSADESYRLINGNIGIANHHYFQQKELYEDLFEDVWEQLRELKVVRKTLKDIDNSDLFKYSPYKSLSVDQVASLIEILEALAADQFKTIMVSGSAGTGKSVLAIFLFKLLNTDLDTFKFVELGTADQQIVALVEAVKKKYPNLKMGLVIPMASFRKTVSRIFSQVKGLNRSMVIGPSSVAREKFDILLVDESHRLRRRVNLGPVFSSFDKNSQLLGLDPSKTSELQWVLKQSYKTLLFYDAGQSIKPSDVQKVEFDQVAQAAYTKQLKLNTQLRSKGGEALVDFIKKLLQIEGESVASLKKVQIKGYELLLFDHLSDLIHQLNIKEKQFGLCRLVAGYAWSWLSKKDPSLYDIQLDGVSLKWNTKTEDWINSENARNEVGCIHTVQGYDLNYVGIIFGPEITFNTQTGLIEVIKSNYKDRTGKDSIKDPKELHKYIQHIYSTMMLRGIKGAYVFVADPALREYFARYLNKYEPLNKNSQMVEVPLFELNFENEQLVEKSESIIYLHEDDVLDNPKHLIACRIQKDGSEPKEEVAIIRILHEEATAPDFHLNAQPDTQSEWRVAELQAFYGKRNGLPSISANSRYIVIKLNGKEGKSRTVVGRFEKLLGGLIVDK